MRHHASYASKLLSGVAFAAFLSGCAVQTFPTLGILHDGLTGMVGAPVEGLVAKIGYPDNDVTVGGRKVYTWDHRSAFTFTVPETICREKVVERFTPNRPRAPVHRKVVRVCETQQVDRTVLHFCTINVEADDADKITGYTFDGNADGCERFAVVFRNLPYEACIGNLSGLKFAVNIGTEPQEKLSAAIARCEKMHR